MGKKSKTAEKDVTPTTSEPPNTSQTSNKKKGKNNKAVSELEQEILVNTTPNTTPGGGMFLQTTTIA